MNAKKYIVRIVFSIVLIVLFVLGLNYSVDPYAITGAVRINHFNQYKVEINNHTRLSKKYQPLLREHNTLIVGNSRVEMGINPDHRCFISSGWKAYNLGMPGAGVRTQLEYALNVMYQQPIDRVLLSLDFTDFLTPGQRSGGKARNFTRQSTGELAYLTTGQANPNYFGIKMLDYYRSLFSLDAFVASLKTLALQSDSASDRDDAGFNPARDFAKTVRIEGPRALFDQKMQVLDQKYSAKWYMRDAAGQLNQSFDDIAEFLSIAAERRVEVYLFTNPFHQSYWDLLEEQGLKKQYSDWLASIEALARTHEIASLALWDFSMDSPYIHEEIPARGAITDPLNWFWEPAHYRRELGDIMLESMLSESCGTEVVFGEKLL